jgi:hypothetical protein
MQESARIVNHPPLKIAGQAFALKAFFYGSLQSQLALQSTWLLPISLCECTCISLTQEELLKEIYYEPPDPVYTCFPR